MTAIPTALQALIASVAAVEFAPGETLIAPDARNPPLWLIESGLVRLYALAADGSSYNLGFHGRGDWVCGQLALRDGRLCCADRALGVDALQPTRAVPLSMAALDRLRHADGDVAAWMFDRLLELNALRLGREADLVQRSASERYRELTAKQLAILEQVPLHQIAAWLGITAVALSRIRRSLRSG